ncbi:hypothetical protein GGF31_002717 [Allomyces arbusculus]|nr:hypothetical protein GGF31_002717 [Allomyces arbusculus]
MLTHWLASCGPFRESRDNAFRLPTIDPASFSAILAHLASPSTWRPPIELCLIVMLDALYLDLHAAVDACLLTAAENVDDVESLEGVPAPLVMAIARRLDVPSLARADSIVAAAGGDTRRIWLDHLARIPDALDAIHRVDMARTESVVAYLAPPVPRSALPTAGDVTRAIALPAILSADDVAWIRTVAHRAFRPVELVLENGATVPTYVPPPAPAEKLLARRKVAAQYSSHGKLAVETTATTTVSTMPKDDFPDSSDTSPPTLDAIRTATPIRVVASGTDFTLHPSAPSLLLAWPLTRLVIRSTPLSAAQLTNLCTWLGSPHSAVTYLSLTHGTLDESGLAHLLTSLPRTPPTHLDFAHNTHQCTPSRGDKALIHALRAWCRALPPTAGVDLSLADNSFLPALAMSLVATLAAHADRFASLRVARVPLAAALDASAITPLWSGMTAVDLVGTRVHAPVLAEVVARLAECAAGLTDVRMGAASDAVVGAIARAVPAWTNLHLLSVTAATAPVLVADETFGIVADAIAGHRAVEVVDWTGLDVPETAIGTVIAGRGGRRLTVVLGDVGTRMYARLGKMVAEVGKEGREVVLWTVAGMVTNIRGARRR